MLCSHPAGLVPNQSRLSSTKQFRTCSCAMERGMANFGFKFKTRQLGLVVQLITNQTWFRTRLCGRPVTKLELYAASTPPTMTGLASSAQRLTAAGRTTVSGMIQLTTWQTLTTTFSSDVGSRIHSGAKPTLRGTSSAMSPWSKSTFLPSERMQLFI